MKQYEITSDGEQTSIRCLLCNSVSFNFNDILNKYCGRCHLFLENEEQPPPPMPTPQVSQQGDPDRQKKIIVALFLILGKALKKLPANDREIQVTEDEIRLAWMEQKSPVRLVSQNTWLDSGRVFRTVLEDLDLNKTGMFTPGEKYPSFHDPPPEPNKETERRRIFDLE